MVRLVYWSEKSLGSVFIEELGTLVSRFSPRLMENVELLIGGGEFEFG